VSAPRTDKLATVFVVLVALHSYAVGVGLLLLPRFSLPIGGFEVPDALFFVHQGGVFHLVVASGYLMEWQRHRTIDFMLLTKCLATAFLAVSWALIAGAPWLIGASALQDGAMAAAALWLVLSGRVTTRYSSR